ncbi:alkaline phosphatase [Halobacillus andaensis]|uniref:Alkaline phosphatase n=1 Tax=Halobacillus andaensis TaxID=1176239 RepID=A0A917B1N5_HALAA|nr:alkaline phosphatase [Halobacillus andaensis]MBP2003995.1 alkaline phosphatase [Halobacillus andaensis]GGF14994.1 alkaline phosphatase [Halobacillus andaensis]
MSIKKKVSATLAAGAIFSGSMFALTSDHSPLSITADEKQESNVEVDKKSPKNVIVMVGDGLGVGQMEIARLLESGKTGDLFMESLENVGMMRTYSDDNFVTDSGAAGSAIATGNKTYNGGIGVDAEGEEVDSILDLYQNEGKKVGVISTNTVTDATPAAFTASVPDRDGQDEIARQMLDQQYDVLLGGGADYFSPDSQDGTDLVEEFQSTGYEFVDNESSLEESGTPDKLLGLFNDSYMSYKTDRDELNSEEPTLEAMTDKGLDVLSQDDDGFFLMVEGARIDHAAHAADATGVWQETMEFDRTVEQVVNWAEDRDDTMVVVLADHETMGMSATEPMDIEGLKDIEVSPEYMAQQMEINEETGTYTEDSVKQVFAEHADIDLSDADVDEFLTTIQDDDGEVYAEYRVGWEIGSIIADHYKVGAISSEIRAESGTGGHTGNMVPVFATGAGSEDFEGVMDNTDIIELIANSAKDNNGKGPENSNGNGKDKGKGPNK